jgi:hypothetical protein
MRKFFAGIFILFFFQACQNNGGDHKLDREPLSDSVSIYGVNEEDVKLVKKGSIELKVKNVEASMRAVSHAAKDLGGAVFHQNMHAEESSRTERKLSQDSLLVISSIIPHADITARVPSHQLEAFLYAVADLGYFTRNSQLNIEDKSLEYLHNFLKQRNRKEVLTANAALGKKPAGLQTIQTKDEIAAQQITNRIIDGEAAYSLVNLSLFQNPIISREVVSNSDLSAYQLSFSRRLGQALEDGWVAFLNLVVALAHVWVLLLVAVGLYVFYRVYWKGKAML